MTDESLIHVAGVQMDIAIGRVADNLDKTLGYAAETAERGARLTIFPECALSGYCFDDEREALSIAEEIPGPSTERLMSFCDETGGYLVVGMLERFEQRIYNSCCLIGPHDMLLVYRKTHLPYLGIDRFATPGESFTTATVGGSLRLGIEICYDCRFPELTRILSLQGVDAIALPTNWPEQSADAADVLPTARSYENKIYFLAVNRVGTERGTRFLGRSTFCDPYGKTIARAGEDEEIIEATLTPSLSRDKNLVRKPGRYELHLFKDRRVDLYGDLLNESADHGE